MLLLSQPGGATAVPTSYGGAALCAWQQAQLQPTHGTPMVTGSIACSCRRSTYGHGLHHLRLQAQLEPTQDGAFKADDPLYLLLALAKKFRFVNADSLSLEATYTNGTQRLR